MDTSESSGEVKVTVPHPSTPDTKISTAHSTPIQNIIKNKTANSPEINYHESPIEPLTQNPPNEVGWDYQRPVLKEEQSASSEITKTPKRTALLSKKRNSNSPLLYKPLKKKLIQDEKQSYNSFITDLQAIEINTKRSKEKHAQELAAESQLVVDLDSQPSEDSDLNLEVSTNTEESPIISNTANNKLGNNKYKELLDDSVEDAVMIICSQKVEEKERIISKVQQTAPSIARPMNKENSVKPTTNDLIAKTELNSIPKELDNSMDDLLAYCSQRVEEKVLGIPTTVDNHRGNSIEVTFKLNVEKSFKKPKNEDIKPSNSNEKVVTVNDESRDSCSSKGESNSLEIPDDSFDEIFGELDENFCKNENTESIVNRVNKSFKGGSNLFSKTVSSTLISKTSSQVTQMISGGSKNTYVCVDSRASNPTIQNKMLNTKANFGYLNKDYMQNNLTSSSTQASSTNKAHEVRTFKTKSYSDSNFIEQSTSVHKFDKSESNLNSIRQNDQSIKSTNQNSNNSKISGTNESINWRRSSSSSSLSTRTPAEIERKRQEALMKRQANLNKKRSQNATMDRHAQVKR